MFYGIIGTAAAAAAETNEDEVHRVVGFIGSRLTICLYNLFLDL
jgi:hypothetical protein